MASIRVRLTAWNGGVLVVVLCLFAIAAYALIRRATFTQVDRALNQQMSVVVLTAEALNLKALSDSEVTGALTRDLDNHGLFVIATSSMANTLVTAPIRIDEDDEDKREVEERRPATADIDWSDLKAKLSALRDDDDAFTVRARRGGVRALTKRLDIGGQSLTVVATQPLHETMELLEMARFSALIALPIALLLSILFGYALARRALDPIAKMTGEARRIGSRNVHERLSVRNPDDELGQLALTFNDVLERVDGALEHQRRFTADASHELRTPVALIRAEADVALSGSTSPREYQAALGVIRDASQQLSRIVNDLFLLARADAGQTVLSPHPMYLDEVVRASVLSMRSLADENKMQLHVETPTEVPYQADEELLRRALSNLLDNAIKYSLGHGNIHVRLAQGRQGYLITVTDDGPGIDPNDQLHIFERFFRGDSSRAHNESTNGAGAGLGLAIAREIAVLHGGQLELLRSDALGSSFELILPAQRSGAVVG